MKKELRRTDPERGIVSVTTVDERWYFRERLDPITGVPAGHDFVPSVTWIAGKGYPKGVGFYKWLAMKGWDEAEAIRSAAGDKGSKVHQAIVALVDGQAVPMEARFVNPSTGQPEELSLEEYQCLLAFRDWWRAARPETLAREVVVWSDEHGYAGTVDWLGMLHATTGDKGQPEEEASLWLLDWKTGQEVWPEHRLQVSAYGHAPLPIGTGPLAMPGPLHEVDRQARLGILQIGYRRNTRGWKFTEVEDAFDLFLAAKAIWAAETAGEAPLQVEYPLAVSLNGADPAPILPRPRTATAKARGRH